MRKHIIGFILFVILLSLSVPVVVADGFTVSSPFGWRISPITGQWEFHTGIDIPANFGAPIEALFDGVVVWAGWRGGYGNTVILQHENTAYTLYGHCERVTVYVGQTVKAGDAIGIVGSTGMSTGPHLHLGYWINNQYLDPMVIWRKPVPQVTKRNH